MILSKILKNISYSISANLVSLFISIFMIIIAPKYLTSDEYGLWQLFLFYFYYMGFSHLGWREGIYLRYAGKYFDQLDANVFSGQLYGFIVLQLVVLIVIIGILHIVVLDPIKQLALTCAVLLAPFVNFSNLCYSLLQTTNRIQSYARLLMIENGLFLGGLVIFLFGFQLYQFQYMYYAKVLSLVVVTIISIYLCRRLLVPSFCSLVQILIEAKKNIIVGSQLMIAYLAGMLILGVVRYGISIGWDVTTFGKVSLSLSISNFLIAFISAISIVFFPILKRMNEENRIHVYKPIRLGLDCILLGLLLLYYPLQLILSWWLPQYTDSLLYLSVLFPICLFDSKLHILVNTYFKSMRKETLMLKLNVFIVLLSALATIFTVYVFHNLNLTVFSVIVIYAIQCCLAEYCISSLIKIDLKKNILVDLVMCSIFVISAWSIHNAWCMVIYGIAYIVFLFTHREPLRNLIISIKEIQT